MPERRHRTDKVSPTRKYSKAQEDKVASAFAGQRTLNSGATPFQKGDVLLDSFLLECKTKVTHCESMSIKKEWLEKNEKEALFMGKPHSALVFNFGPNEKNYYIIDEYLFKMLTQSISDGVNNIDVD